MEKPSTEKRKQVVDLLGRDPALKRCIEELEFPELRPSARGMYEDLIRSILFQQLAVKAAESIYSRFLALFPSGHPTPSELLSRHETELRTAGVSSQKSSYLHEIASFFDRNENRDRDWDAMSDEELSRELTSIRGVGSWTAKMILLFNLGREDIFAPEDLGIQIAMRELCKIEGSGKELHRKMDARAREWAPYRSYACLYLWSWKDR